MELEITTMFVLCDELLTAMGDREDPQIHMTNAEVMLVSLTAARYFHGHIRNAQHFLAEHQYVLNMLSESRLNRRIHALHEGIWVQLFSILAETAKDENASQQYCLDSFPIPVCDNIRIKRAKLYQGEEFRGYIASKRRYFFGLRVHMIVTAGGQPVEFLLRPGEEADVSVYQEVNFDLPNGAECYADKAYNVYDFEDLLKEAVGITMKPARKKNSKRAIDPYVVVHYEQYVRKQVETAFSQITNFFPKHIHAVTRKGFELKVMFFILAYTIESLHKLK